MRVTLAVVVLLGLSVGTDAQSSLRPEHRSAFALPTPGTGLSLPPIGLPLPSIGLPLPSIGLPLPSIGLPLPHMGFPPFGRERLAAVDGVPGDFTDRLPAFEARHRGRRSGGSVGRSSARTVFLFLPVVGRSHPEIMTRPASASAGAAQTPAVGHVRLALQPGVVPQIYVDGYFVGTLDDVGGELALDAGPHVLELRADGYEVLEVAVNVTAGRSITYRGRLQPTVAAAPSSAAAVQAPVEAPPLAQSQSTFYVVPGCYAGDVPPQDVGLPAGCDGRRAIVFTPPPR